MGIYPPHPLDMIKEYLELSFTESLETILYPTSPLIHWSVVKWRRTAQGTDWAIGAASSTEEV